MKPNRLRFLQIQQKANNRFELTEKFLKYNIELANDRTNEEKLHLYKKVGSNFKILDRTVFFEPRGAWRNLLNSGIFGGNAFVSALRADPISASNSDFQFWRKGRDSNPRSPFGDTAFRERRLQPLGHLSSISLLYILPFPLFPLCAENQTFVQPYLEYEVRNTKTNRGRTLGPRPKEKSSCSKEGISSSVTRAQFPHEVISRTPTS